MSKSASRYYSAKGPELLIDMVDQASHILSTQGKLAPQTAEDLAIQIADTMARRWGGQLIYFPSGTWNGGALSCFQLTDRDWKIFQTYNGTNRREICDQFSISTQRLYQIITSCRLELSSKKARPTDSLGSA